MNNNNNNGVSFPPAFDTEVILSDGKELRLSEMWKEKPIILVFLRHLGCPFCRKLVSQLRDSREKIYKAGFRVVMVGMAEPKESQIFRHEMKTGFPLICDPERALYKEYGLKKGGILDIASPQVLVKGLKAIHQGHRLQVPKTDPLQMGGVFVIDTQGFIRWSYISRDPADNPEVCHILEKVGSQ